MRLNKKFKSAVLSDINTQRQKLEIDNDNGISKLSIHNHVNDASAKCFNMFYVAFFLFFDLLLSGVPPPSFLFCPVVVECIYKEII